MLARAEMLLSDLALTPLDVIFMASPILGTDLDELAMHLGAASWGSCPWRRAWSMVGGVPLGPSMHEPREALETRRRARQCLSGARALNQRPGRAECRTNGEVAADLEGGPPPPSALTPAAGNLNALVARPTPRA